MNDVKTGVYVNNGEEFEFNYYTKLTVAQSVGFVNSVVSIVVGDNYYSFLKNVAFDFAIVSWFTDVDLTEIIESDNVVDKVEQFLEDNNIVDVIKDGADFGAIYDLERAVDKAIEYKTGIHVSEIEKSLSSLLDTIDAKISEFDVDGMSKAMNVFSNMKGEITADKMLEAYAKSDIFKKQYEDTAEKQEKRDAAMKVIRENTRKDSAKIISAPIESSISQE